MDNELDLIELLPDREELSFLSLGNTAFIGLIAQHNSNFQLGGINFNAQANYVTVNG
jgi:hypothetical protein